MKALSKKLLSLLLVLVMCAGFFTVAAVAEEDETEHTWADPVWTWDGTEPSVTRTCTVCGAVEAGVIISESSSNIVPTCTDDGREDFTATAEFSDGTTTTDSISIIIPALGHRWGEPSWSWTDDGGTIAFADSTCSVCNLIERFVADMDYETIEPTCTTPGQLICNASIELDGSVYTTSRTINTEPPIDHTWGDVTWTWDYSTHNVISAVRSCTVCGTEDSAVDFLMTASIIYTPCDENNWELWAATAIFSDGTEAYDSIEEEMPNTATEHTWGTDVEWTWEGSTAISAVRTCEVCGAEYYADDITVMLEDYSYPTCTEDGYESYSATATFSDGVEADDSERVTVPATGHSWVGPDWSWTDDGGTIAFADFICSVCGDGVRLTADMDYETVDPTCTTPGQLICNASVELDGSVYTTSKTIDTEPALGHTWSSITWDWADDFSTVKASRECTVCGYIDTRTGYPEIYSEVAPTCTEDGEIEYHASVNFDSAPIVGQKIVVIPATGHDWNDVVWTWSSDNSSAAATRTCKTCGYEDEANVIVTSETTEPTNTQDGQTVYTATATFISDGTGDTATKTVVIPAKGEPNTSVLEQDINLAESLTEDNYTEESWNNLQEALKAAETVLNGGNATQAEVDAVADALAQAVMDLVPAEEVTAADKTALDIAISAADALNASDYTEESWAALQNALSVAEAICSSSSSTQEQVDAVLDILLNAIGALEKSSGSTETVKTTLDVAISAADTLVSSDYTSESWTVVEEALNAAKDVMDDPNATQDQVNEAFDALEEAINALVKADTGELFTGFKLNSADGNWYYYIDNEIAYGLNSVLEGTVNGSNGWWYIVDGQVQLNYTGVCNYCNDYGWWYVKDGKVDFSCNSVENNNYGWWYVLGGKVDFSYTGVANYANDYGWWYINAGKVDFSKTSIEPNQYGWWRVVDGKVDFSCNSVEQNDYGWWYVVGGQVQFSYTGVANYANAYGWWYINAGKVDFSKTSIEPNNYGWWRVVNGKVDFSCNSVEQNDYGWWYVVGGQVQFSYTGVANYANAYGWWYIKDGKVDFSFTGWETNDYGRWYCVNGKVDFSKS